MVCCLYSHYWGWLCSNRSSCSLSTANTAAEHAGCAQRLGWQHGVFSAHIQETTILWSRRTLQCLLLRGRMKWDGCKYYHLFIRIRSRNYLPLSLLKPSQRNFYLLLNSITKKKSHSIPGNTGTFLLWFPPYPYRQTLGSTMVTSPSGSHLKDYVCSHAGLQNPLNSLQKRKTQLHISKA